MYMYSRFFGGEDLFLQILGMLEVSGQEIRVHHTLSPIIMEVDIFER